MTAHLPRIKERSTAAFAKALGAQLLATKDHVGETSFTIARGAIVEACRIARDQFGYQQLMEIAGADYPERPERFEVNYHLLSITENHRIRLESAGLAFDLEINLPPCARPQTRPAMAHRELHPGFPQPMHPAAQQRRGLEFARINAATRRHERLHSQLRRPFPQRIGIEFREERRPQFGRLSRAGVAGGEAFARFGVGEIQTPATGDEKLPAHRRLGIEQRHGRTARRRHFRGAQTRRTAADDRNVDAQSKQSPPRRATPFAGESSARHAAQQLWQILDGPPQQIITARAGPPGFFNSTTTRQGAGKKAEG